MTEAHYEVSGMTCEHCVRAVTEELTALSGVAGVHVELLDGARAVVTVESAAPLRHGDVAAAIDEAGYRLES